MTTEISLIISLISVGFAIFMGVLTAKRNKSLDDKGEASQTTTVIVKLEYISNNIVEIKKDMRDLKNENKDFGERLIKIEESLKVAWHNIEELKIGKAKSS